MLIAQQAEHSFACITAVHMLQRKVLTVSHFSAAVHEDSAVQLVFGVEGSCCSDMSQYAHTTD